EILKIKVIDRSSIILDIFANHAKTAQSRTQVELAQYKYLLPRLKGFWKHLERQGGGIGTRGPGETELETDRRIVKEKISFLTQKLQKIEQQAKTQRKLRKQLPNIALVGYTNAGKSAIMNILSKEKLLSENKLFVTLDTTTRRIYLDGINFLVSDTVGFIRKLPHHLIESFKSTLEEVRKADILIHVMDIAHPNCEEQYIVVQKTLQDLGIDNVPTINVLNKRDLFIKNQIDPLLSETVIEDIMNELQQKWEYQTQQSCIILSASTQDYINELKVTLHEYLRKWQSTQLNSFT
ncbi:MAG: GTPase HflX, partial [Chitinophagaceae bacterium]